MTARTAASDRRGELLTLAAELFADRGLRATTVRDIADAAGILSGSLYHHFDSKESMVDEILREFLDELFARYRAIAASDLAPRPMLEALVEASFESMQTRRDAVAIYQREARALAEVPRFGYIRERNDEFRELWFTLLRDGMADGTFRADLDVEVVYRFLRDTVWVGVGWYRSARAADAAHVAGQYVTIVLDGIATRRKPARRR
jgi:AcrR family transcriptional regulator